MPSRKKKHHHPKRALGHQYILITVQRTLDCTTYHARSLIQRTIVCSNFSLDTTVYYIPPTTTILELAPHSLMIKHHKSASSDGLSTNVLIDPWGSIFLGVISSRREESQESTSSPFLLFHLHSHHLFDSNCFFPIFLRRSEPRFPWISLSSFLYGL